MGMIDFGMNYCMMYLYWIGMGRYSVHELSIPYLRDHESCIAIILNLRMMFHYLDTAMLNNE